MQGLPPQCDSLLFVMELGAVGWFVGCRVKANYPLVRLGPVRGVHSLVVFLRDPSPYLHEFRRKTRKTPNGLVDKRYRELNLELGVKNSQFRQSFWTILQYLASY